MAACCSSAALKAKRRETEAAKMLHHHVFLQNITLLQKISKATTRGSIK